MSFTWVVWSFRVSYACTFYVCCFFSKYFDSLPRSEKYLTSDNMFISIARNSLKLPFDDGHINQEQHNKYRFACWSLNEARFADAWKRFPLDNDVLKHYRILNFHNERCSFERSQRLVESLNHNSKFMKKARVNWKGNSVHWEHCHYACRIFFTCYD